MKYWKKVEPDNQRKIVMDALDQNINYKNRTSLGVPGSRLDNRVFYDQASFLKEAPYLQAIVQNPNHIGCHTLGDSEPYFAGTQKIEQEVIQLIAHDILHAKDHSIDGYLASGGTEANIQACWMYRNFFIEEEGLKHSEIGIICSEDTHYSISKASNLLNIPLFKINVDFNTRQIQASHLEKTLLEIKNQGIKRLIVIANMGTTMFGSVDNPYLYDEYLNKFKIPYKLHVDAAFGGFIYPIVNPEASKKLTFHNPKVDSITLDAHKMLQAPYGTGIFLTRKNQIQSVNTLDAQYVNGLDLTLIGSRSGANAISVWMILQTYGPYSWKEKLNILLYRTTQLCEALDQLNIEYFREDSMNIITIKADEIPAHIAESYGLVPDTHESEVKWRKIVIMDHVEMELIHEFVDLISLNTIPSKQSS